ncbi:hypothetical protein [Nocardia transvalensis]|uniref:hypothetical protein n=1 Tax=Nocardia transvalensis TaxID=37333 RepID=UPI001894439D|nr:hypothetical protein [Nocardia transvalensis]MBF6330496.1 hypothetical protein [Nocardia transvalensis]
MSYEEYRRRIIDAQQQWNAERDWIYKTQAQGNYSGIFDGDMQPPHLTKSDSFEHMSIEQMRDSVAAMKPKLVYDAVSAWAKIGMDLAGAFALFEREFGRTTNGGWTGVAADAAVDAVKRYSERSTPLSQAATAISLKLSEMRTGLEETQALMPGVPERTIVSGKTLPKDGVMKIDDHNRAEAEEEGRRILRTIYGQVAAQTDVGMPYMPSAPKIVDGVGVPSGPVGPTSVDPGGTDQGGRGSDTDGQPGDRPGEGGQSGESPQNGESGDQQGDTRTASAGMDSTNSAGMSQQSSGQPSQSGSASTSPAGYTPGGTSGVPGVGGYSGGRSGPGGRGSSAGPGGGGGPGSRVAGGPGRSVPGGVIGGAPAAASVRPGIGAPGAAGMPGMGFPGHAGKGQDEEERTKGVPDYLITQEHGNELIGVDELPKAVPPVIGGDDAQR